MSYTEKRAFAKKLDSFLVQHRSKRGIEQLCRYAASWYVWNICGIYASDTIETILAEQAAVNISKATQSTTPRTKKLIVMSELYVHGGHTRLAERLIKESSADQFTLFVTQQIAPFPETFSAIAVEKKCDILFSQTDNPFQAAEKLRTVATNFQSIILIIHPDDIIPNLAFSDPSFPIPVYLYNHGDHQFWLGSSIADLVICQSTPSAQFSRTHRGAQESAIIPIPVSNAKPSSINRDSLRSQRGISPETFVIFTAASPWKYTPSESMNFFETMTEILSTTGNHVRLVAAGPKTTDPQWEKLVAAFPERVSVLGVISHDLYSQWIACSDLCVDSIPVSGWTFILEAVSYSVPTLFVRSGEWFPDSLMPFALPYDQIVPRAIELIRGTTTFPVIDISQHSPNWFAETFHSVTDEPRLHRIGKITVHSSDDEIDELTACMMANIPSPETPHLFIFLLDLPFTLRVSTIKFFLENREYRSALVLLLLTKRSYSWIKSILKQ